MPVTDQLRMLVIQQGYIGRCLDDFQAKLKGAANESLCLAAE